MRNKNFQIDLRSCINRESLSEIGIEIFGSFLIAIGIYNFAVNAQFPMTGFSGISIILYRLLRTSHRSHNHCFEYPSGAFML